MTRNVAMVPEMPVGAERASAVEAGVSGSSAPNAERQRRSREELLAAAERGTIDGRHGMENLHFHPTKVLIPAHDHPQSAEASKQRRTIEQCFTHVTIVKRLRNVCLSVVGKRGMEDMDGSIRVRRRMIRVSHGLGVHKSPQRPSLGPPSLRQLPSSEPLRRPKN